MKKLNGYLSSSLNLPGMRLLSPQHLAQCFETNIVYVARGDSVFCQWKEWPAAYDVGLVALSYSHNITNYDSIIVRSSNIGDH